MSNVSPPQNDIFEIVAAFVLGLAVVLTAWASFQSGEWGGESVKAYAEGGKLTTEAGTQFQTTFVRVVRDNNIDIQGKTMLQNALLRKFSGATDDPLVEADITIARYLYTHHISRAAYERLGLPIESLSAEHDVWSVLPEEALMGVFELDLGDQYVKEELQPAQALFETATTKFAEGGRLDEVADRFDLVVVLLTVAMFFAGIAQSFKSAMRWPILVAGAAACAVAGVLLLGLPSAPSGDGLDAESVVSHTTVK
jgi:hypothetical protein